MKRLFRLSLVWIGASAVLLAAGFWDKKEFSEWSDREVARMLENSPWAREVSIMRTGGAGFDRPGGDVGADPGGGGDAAGGGGFPGGGGRGGRGGGPGDSELSRPAATLHVRWMSALPVKQAFIRSTMTSEQELDDRARKFLSRVETHYVIAVSGIPKRMLGAAEGTERLVQLGRLDFGKNREPLVPEKVEVRPEQNRLTLFFLFPRTNPITLDDKNAEFIFKAEGLDLKRKFKLQDMMYQGKLEL